MALRPLPILVTCIPALAGAQPPEGEGGNGQQTELAKQTQNPIADLISVPFQFNFNSGGALDDRSSLNLNIQPVIPVQVTADINVIARPIIPVYSLAQPEGDSDTGMGDIQLQLFGTPESSGAFIWGVGPVLSFPTATLDAVTTGSWAVGPAGVVVLTTGPWVIGGLVTQAWTFADSGDDREVNSFLFQPFVNYNLGRGWALSSAPNITANWDAPDNGWIVPVGGGMTWTTKIGGQAMNLGVQYYYRVERPDTESRNQLRFVVAFLFPEPPRAPASGEVARGQPTHDR